MLSMTQRIYIDTSVIGGMFDEEFQVFTKLFFDRVLRKEIRLITSELLEGELLNALNGFPNSIGLCQKSNANL